MEKLEKEITKMVVELKKKESTQDSLLKLTRELVRECSVSIKCLHSGEMEKASSHHKKAGSLLKKISSLQTGFENLVSQSYQEYAEVSLLMALVRKEEVPLHTDLGIPFSAYMTGICDCIGELRRQMLEELRHGNRKEAEYYFETMNSIYEMTAPLRFSNSILPNFRKKQDVARFQVENARSELLKSGVNK